MSQQRVKRKILDFASNYSRQATSPTGEHDSDDEILPDILERTEKGGETGVQSATPDLNPSHIDIQSSKTPGKHS